MAYKKLFIMIEGNDDERFFEKIIIPSIKKSYDSTILTKYKQTKRKSIRIFINAINIMNNDYLYVEDIHSTPCISVKKQKIQSQFKNMDENRIIIVINEIESWYLAGLDNKAAKRLTKRSFRTTDSITKDEFNKLISKKFNSRIDFMLEILKEFSVKTAKQKNKSFNYFMKKYC